MERAPLLQLVFTPEGDPLELQQTKFDHRLNREPLEADRSRSSRRHFDWRTGCQALCICFLEYLLHHMKQSPGEFQFTGPQDHPAKTLDEAIGKARKSDSNKYFGDILGGEKDSRTGKVCLYEQLFIRGNPQQKRQHCDISLKLRQSLLPPDSIQILRGARWITEIGQLESMHAELCRTWRENTRLGTTSGLKEPTEGHAGQSQVSHSPSSSSAALTQWASAKSENVIKSDASQKEAGPKTDAGLTPTTFLKEEPAVAYEVHRLASSARVEGIEFVPKAVPNNLPRHDRSMVGRAHEIETMLRVLAKSSRCWVVSITGVGGIGKTALALEVAHRCLALCGLPENLAPDELSFDAIVWTSAKQKELDGPAVRFRLSVKSNLSSIVQAILKTVTAEKAGALPSEERQLEIALELLNKKRILLVVDNMEAIEDDQVVGFLSEVPMPSKVIVTDRRAVHESRSLPLTELSVPDAMRLIREHCSSDILRNRVHLSDDHVSAIADKTGGNPLAIIWTLGRIAATGSDPETVIRRLADVGSSPVLDFLFQESYDLITPNSRRVLAALALPGTPVMGAMLGDWLNMERKDVEDALDQLHGFALVKVHRPPRLNTEQQTSQPTIQRSYRLLPLSREYVRCRGNPLDVACRQTIGEKLLSFVTEGEENPDWPSIATIDLIDEHHELLSWGVEDAFNQEHHQLVVQMVRVLGYALGIRGYNDLRLRLAAMAAHSARAIGSPRELARALITNTAWVHFFWSDYDKCLAELREGLAAVQEEHDVVLEGIAVRLTA